MAFHVRDPETDRLVRELAKQRGIGLTEAVREAAAEALLQQEGALEARRVKLRDDLKPLLDRLQGLPRIGSVADKAFYDGLWAERGDSD